MDVTFIYGLYSSDNNEIRYVGKANDPKDRLRRHLYGCVSSDRDKTHKCCWIRKVINNNNKIEYKILKECNRSDWPMYEDFFIKQYTNLTNTSKGGYGGSSLTYDITFDDLCEWKLDNVPNYVDTHKKWKSYIKGNAIKNIPINPNKVYKNRGWVSWSSFLNTKNQSPKYYRDNNISFEEFKNWIIKMNIKTREEFKKLSKTSEFPKNIPKSPHLFYKGLGWTYWCDIVSGGKYLKGVYWDYEKCKKYIKDNFGSINVSEFRDLTKKRLLPPEIPKKPERVFDNFNYSSFLNNKNRRNKKFYLTYTECREVAINNKISSRNNWIKYVKTSNVDLIPTNPDSVYKSEWVSWYVFLDKPN